MSATLTNNNNKKTNRRQAHIHFYDDEYVSNNLLIRVRIAP